MIETVSISHNPVTLWERFAEDLHFGSGRRQFSSIAVEHRAMGGFWQARFPMHDTKLNLADFFNSGLGRHVVARTERGEVAFEGFVNSMRLVGAGSVVLYRSLEQVKNSVHVRYKDTAGTFKKSVVASDATSIARYGQKDHVLGGGELTAASIADSVAQQIVDRYKEPKAVPEALRFGSLVQSEGIYLEVICAGYIRTLLWRIYNQTASTGSQSADLELADITAAIGQFIVGTRFQANPYGVAKVYDADRPAIEIMFDIARLGDSYNQRWVLKMIEGRILTYLPAASPVLVDL